jgi:MFS family permease
MRAMRADGALFSVMVGAGETYLPAFALALGAGEIAAGLLAGLPLLGAAVLQLVTPYAVRALGSHRRWVVGCALLQAATFIPLVVAALVGSLSTPLLFAVVLTYWASGLATHPAWNTWASTLVPRSIAPSFFAQRARLGQLSLLAALLVAGATLQLAREAGAAVQGFALIFLAAGLARWLSANALATQSEPVRMPTNFQIVGPRALLRGRAGGAYARLLLLMLALQTSVHVAAPYFSPYMLGELGLSYDRYVVLIAASLAAKAIFAPFAAELAERVGSARVLRASALAIVPLPMLWMISDNFGYLVGLQVVSGMAWATYELLTLLLFFEKIPAAERTSVLTAFQLANSLAIFIGTVAGGWVLSEIGAGRDGYYAIFWLSTVIRLGAVMSVRTIGARAPARAIRIPMATSGPLEI